MPSDPAKTLQDLLQAVEEARGTIRELHEARSALLDVTKAHKKAITDAIVEEVDRQVKILTAEAREDMRAGIDGVISRIESIWRERLGLSD